MWEQSHVVTQRLAKSPVKSTPKGCALFQPHLMFSYMPSKAQICPRVYFILEEACRKNLENHLNWNGLMWFNLMVDPSSLPLAWSLGARTSLNVPWHYLLLRVSRSIILLLVGRCTCRNYSGKKTIRFYLILTDKMRCLETEVIVHLTVKYDNDDVEKAIVTTKALVLRCPSTEVVGVCNRLWWVPLFGNKAWAGVDTFLLWSDKRHWRCWTC